MEREGLRRYYHSSDGEGGEVRSVVREELRPQDLRYIRVTLLLSEGVNAKVVSEMLSLHYISFTPNTYSHMEATLGTIS